MMMRFNFKVSEDLLALVAHAQAGECKKPYTGKPAPAGLWIVSDDGVYLMSGSKTPEPMDKVVYAEGRGSGTHLGGSDFAEFIPLAGLELKLGQVFVVEMDDHSLFLKVLPGRQSRLGLRAKE